MTKEKGIHIVAEGFELDRAIEPIYDYPIEKMYILGANQTKYSGGNKLAKHFVQKIKEELRVEVQTKELDIYNFQEVFEETAQIIQENQNQPIYINISTAPKLSLVAMISAAYLNKRKNMEIFYLKPQEYLLPKMLKQITDDGDIEKIKNEFLEHGFAKGKTGYEEIPVFPIKNIKEIDKKILKVLKNKEAKSISELKNKLEERTQKETKRSTIQYRIKNLEKDGLISTERQNRRLQIKIKKLGKIYID
ncbi:MAG: CARF domain containing protein [Candidatus Methanohalarchaeum thermophilum]|uniref:CARF domain containing protein n=1 Tax=Methanohalarchaeum thermophilum TaxID=1903181 RepID=A0A1Q6DWH8_METT1|nr:MAG: CARF domain containing protein [Candidatus Methanohalarchaeum thermophilum]